MSIKRVKNNEQREVVKKFKDKNANNLTEQDKDELLIELAKMAGLLK